MEDNSAGTPVGGWCVWRGRGIRRTPRWGRWQAKSGGGQVELEALGTPRWRQWTSWGLDSGLEMGIWEHRGTVSGMNPLGRVGAWVEEMVMGGPCCSGWSAGRGQRSERSGGALS